MNHNRSRRNRLFFTPTLAMVGAILACSLPGGQPEPAVEVVLEPTIRPTQAEFAASTLAPTAELVATAIPTASGGQVVLNQPSAILIAYVGPQTGTGSALFVPLQQASQKALEDHGLVHDFGVTLISFNDFCTEEGGAAAAEQIAADENIVAVIGPVCYESATGALPILEANNVVMISGSARPPGLSVHGPTVFHRSLLDDDQAHALGYPSQIYIEDLPSVQAWLADFAAWGGLLLETGSNHFSPYQYDAMGVLLRALDLSSQVLNDGSLVIDREALRAAVRSTTNYPGVTGYITFEADGDRSP